MEVAIVLFVIAIVIAAVLAGMHHGIERTLDPGAMATGTHGTGTDLGSLATMARGFRLIGADELELHEQGAQWPRVTGLPLGRRGQLLLTDELVVECDSSEQRVFLTLHAGGQPTAALVCPSVFCAAASIRGEER